MVQAGSLTGRTLQKLAKFQFQISFIFKRAGFFLVKIVRFDKLGLTSIDGDTIQKLSSYIWDFFFLLRSFLTLVQLLSTKPVGFSVLFAMAFYSPGSFSLLPSPTFFNFHFLSIFFWCGII